MKVDYLIVGFGLAGMAFTAELEKANKSFVVIDDNPNRTTRVVGGMYNPIILKRFTPAWKAHEMWQLALPFYKDLEKKFQQKYIYPFEIRRILQSVEEQNNWVVASDRVVMSEYMTPEIIHEKIKGIDAAFGFGQLKNTGRIAGEQLLDDYKNFLSKNGLLLQQTFHYDELVVGMNHIKYHNIEAKKVVFSEGAYLHQNPYFNYLPMNEAKGEMLVIEVPGLSVEHAIKSSVFMVPFAKHVFVVGATYNWEDKSFESTDEARAELETKLKRFLKLPYKIIDYKVGIRPTIKDRRPLVGKHPKYPNLAVLNGLGTRGVIIAPAIAKELFNHIEYDKPILDEMNIDRFEKLL